MEPQGNENTTSTATHTITPAVSVVCRMRELPSPLVTTTSRISSGTSAITLPQSNPTQDKVYEDVNSQNVGSAHEVQSSSSGSPSTSQSVTPAVDAPSTRFTPAQSATQGREHEIQASTSGTPSVQNAIQVREHEIQPRPSGSLARINGDPNNVKPRPDEALQNAPFVWSEFKEQVILEAKNTRHVIIFPKRITTCQNILKRLRSMIPYCQVKETLKYDISHNVIMDILYPKDALLTLWSTNTSKVYLPYDAKFQARVRPSPEDSNVMKNEYFFYKLVTCHYCQENMLLTLECHSNGKTFLYALPREEVRPFVLDQTMKLVHSRCLTGRQIRTESDECNNFLFKISCKDRPFSQWENRGEFLPVNKFLVWLFLLIFVSIMGIMFYRIFRKLFSHLIVRLVKTIFFILYSCFILYIIVDTFHRVKLWRQINQRNIIAIWRPILTNIGE